MKSTLSRGLLLCGILAAAIAWPTEVQAQGAAAAEALFRQGREASDKGDHATACAKFEESHRLDPAVGTIFNIADCKEKLGLVASAWTRFQEVAQKVPAGDNRRQIAVDRAKALESRIPKLTVLVQGELPAGTEIKRGRTPIGSASLGVALPVDPGSFTIVVTAPGRKLRKYPVKIGEGENRTVTVSAGSATASTPDEGEGGITVVGPGGPGDGSDHGTGGGLEPGYVVGGIGLLGVAVGTITGFMTLGKKTEVDKECPQRDACSQAGIDAKESGETLGTVSVVSFLVGAVGLSVGGFLLLSAPDKPSEARTTLHPVAAPGLGWISLRHRF